MSGINDATKLATLFKKQLGYTNIDNSAPLASEYPANAAPTVMLDKLFTQLVPTIAPAKGSAINNPAATIGSVAPGVGYPYIKYYTNVQLTSWTGKANIFEFVPIAGYPNLLKNIIPFNYDPNGGYDILLEVFNGSGYSTIFKENYILDRDAGMIRIVSDNTGQVSATRAPRLSYFWRYEGTLGDIASASSGGSTSTSFISTATSDLNMSSFRITNLSAPFSTMDAVNKLYVDFWNLKSNLKLFVQLCVFLCATLCNSILLS